MQPLQSPFCLHYKGASLVVAMNTVRIPSVVFCQEDIDAVKDTKLYQDDVWVVSYPKSGSTWLQQIIKLIKNRGEVSDEEVSRSVLWLEAAPELYPDLKIDEIPRPRAFKSHLPYNKLPCGPPNTTPCKYIYLVRNPKDVVVSEYFHRLFDARFPAPLDFGTFFEKFMEGHTWIGYFDDLLSWLPHREDKNVLFLTYEDMKQDLPSAVTRISTFMGIELSGETIAKICDLSSFESMKTDRSANKCWRYGENDDGTSKFMRKGVVGDWKNHLTPEQSAQIDARCAQVLKGTAFEFKFE